MVGRRDRRLISNDALAQGIASDSSITLFARINDAVSTYRIRGIWDTRAGSIISSWAASVIRWAVDPSLENTRVAVEELGVVNAIMDALVTMSVADWIRVCNIGDTMKRAWGGWAITRLATAVQAAESTITFFSGIKDAISTQNRGLRRWDAREVRIEPTCGAFISRRAVLIVLVDSRNASEIAILVDAITSVSVLGAGRGGDRLAVKSCWCALLEVSGAGTRRAAAKSSITLLSSINYSIPASRWGLPGKDTSSRSGCRRNVAISA